MSNVRWWRNLNLFILMFGLVSGILLYATHPINGSSTWRDVASVLVATAIFWGLACMPFTQRSYRKDLKLRRGEGVLARWTVLPDQWQQFLHNERNLQAVDSALTNLVNVRQHVPITGIEIIVGTDAVIVGDDFCSLTGLGMLGVSGPIWVPSHPPTLDYHMTVTDPTDTHVSRTLRFPVALGHENAARSLSRY